MKKSTRIILLTAICLTSFGIVLAVAGMFSGASLNRIIDSGLWNYTFYQKDDYDNDYREANTYRVSGDDIESISVNWSAGKVSVVSYDGDDILIEETAEEEIDEDTCLRYKTDEGEKELTIDCCRSEVSIQFSAEDHMEKELIVKVPKRLAKAIDVLSLSSDSSAFTVNGIAAEAVSVSTVSGDFRAKAIKCDSIDMYTDSGDMNARFTSCPQDFCYDSTSGSGSVTVPDDSSLLLSFSSTSGRFDSSLKYNRNEDDEYIFGNGRQDFYVSTVSGNFSLNK